MYDKYIMLCDVALKNHRYKSTIFLELFPLKFIFQFSLFHVKVKLAVKRSCCFVYV